MKQAKALGVGSRIPMAYYDFIVDDIEKNQEHLNVSDWIKSAIREYIEIRKKAIPPPPLNRLKNFLKGCVGFNYGLCGSHPYST